MMTTGVAAGAKFVLQVQPWGGQQRPGTIAALVGRLVGLCWARGLCEPGPSLWG